jgi:hypothetical protein
MTAKLKYLLMVVLFLGTAVVSYFVGATSARRQIPALAASQPMPALSPTSPSKQPASTQTKAVQPNETVVVQSPSTQTPAPTARSPRVAGSAHAIRADYKDMAVSRPEVLPLEHKIENSGMNMVSLGAGRLDWTYFKWVGHLNNWSSDVKNTGIDFLSEDSSRFAAWVHVDAAVDALSPLYIKQNPQAAAISWDGKPSPQLVSTMQVVHGQYGQLLLQMIQYIAANYPVDSISINEMFYHQDGYGPDDKAAFMAYTGQSDWPRTASGAIDINDPAIENWRTYELNIFLSLAHDICSKYGKQFFFNVPVSLDAVGTPSSGYGVQLDKMFTNVDKLIIWGYFDLDSLAPENLQNTASNLKQYDPNRIIFLIGLWNKQMQAISAEKLQQAITALQNGGITNIWITPASLMTDAHWSTVEQAWK